MIIVRAARLSDEVRKEINSLMTKCCEEENLKGAIFLDNKLNAIAEMPCFYLAYHDNTLCGLLTIFTPDLRECEIYAYVLPELRKKHIFTNLLSVAKQTLDARNIAKIHFVVEPESESGNAVAKKICGEVEYSEYLLSYDMSIPIERTEHTDLDIEIDEEKDDDVFLMYKDEKLLGMSNINYFHNYATIYEYEIVPDMRGKGYGGILLNELLQYITDNEVDGIILNVNSKNEAAFKLYTHNNFIIKEQLNYYEYS